MSGRPEPPPHGASFSDDGGGRLSAAFTSRLALRGLFVLALVFFVKESQPLLAPIVFAVVLTFVLAPFVRALRRRGVPEVVGAALLVMVLLGSVGLLAASVAEPAALWWQRAPATIANLLGQLERLRAAIPGLGPVPAPGAASVPASVPAAVGAVAGAAPATAPVAAPVSAPAAVAGSAPSVGSARPVPSAARARATTASAAGTGPAVSAGAAQTAAPAGSAAPVDAAVPPPAAAAPDPLKDRLASEGVALTGLLLGRSASFAVAAAATVILLYFLLASEHWLLSRCVEAVPRRRIRALVLGGIRAAQRDIGRYLLAMTLLNIGAGIATGLLVHALGLPNPVLWGALTAALCFVPYIGPLVIMLALLSAGVATFVDEAAMLAPAAAFIAVHAIETNLVAPWVIGRRLSLSPLSVFLSVMLWGWMWGVAGALVAVPILIGLRCVCRRNRRLRLVGVFLDGDSLRPPPTLGSLLGVRRRAPAAAVISPPAGRQPTDER